MGNNTISIQGPDMRTSRHGATEQIQKQTQTQTQQTRADAGHPLAHMLITGHAGRGDPTRSLPIFAPSPLLPAQILRSAYTLGKRIHSTNQYPLKSGLDNHALLNPRVFLSLYSVVSFLFFFFLSNSRNHCTHTTFHDSGWHCKKHNLIRGPQYL